MGKQHDALFAAKLAGSSGGGGGTSDYTDLANKPQINDVTLSGNKSSTDLGLQAEITANNKLSSDLVDDTNATNQFVTSDEKSTWNGKQNALSFDSVPTDGSTNPVESNGIYDALAGKVDKVNGKGLSTEDYTTAEKTALAEQVTKTAGIDSTANSYIEMGNGLRLYISSMEPTGTIPDGSIWIGGTVSS